MVLEIVIPRVKYNRKCEKYRPEVKLLEMPGIDPGTSRMLSGRSTIWATPPWIPYFRLQDSFQYWQCRVPLSYSKWSYDSYLGSVRKSWYWNYHRSVFSWNPLCRLLNLAGSTFKDFLVNKGAMVVNFVTGEYEIIGSTVNFLQFMLIFKD